jgi:hypothetical protein
VVDKLVMDHHVVDAMRVITSLKDRWARSRTGTQAFQAAYNLPMFYLSTKLCGNSVRVEPDLRRLVHSSGAGVVDLA